MKVLAMTVCTVDIYPEQQIECVGGNALNFATQCRRSGVDGIAVLGAIGEDEYGNRVQAYLDGAGIDTSHIYRLPGATATNRIHITPDGDRYFPPDSWDGGVFQSFRLSAEDWAFAQAHDLVAIGAFDPNFRESLKRLKGHTRIAADFLDIFDPDLMEEVLPDLDLAFVTGDQNVADRLAPICERLDSIAVVTLGAEGSITLDRNRPIFQPAAPVETVIDTTGCGDAYQAAFSLSWCEDQSINRAMQNGSASAAQVLSHYGGVPQSPETSTIR